MDRLDEVRSIVAQVLELEDDELKDDASFVDGYEADSLQAIEILSRLEKRFGIEIPQADLPEMQDVLAVYRVVARHAGWR